MKRRKQEHQHSVQDYQKALDIIKSSTLPKSRKRKAIRKVVSRLVDMI